MCKTVQSKLCSIFRIPLPMLFVGIDVLSDVTTMSRQKRH